jgi:multidrug efflux system membrane fusion protein
MVVDRRKRHWIFGALALVVIGLLLWFFFHKKTPKPAPPPPIPVTAEKAVARDLPIFVTALGAAQAWTSDTIFAQVSGKLIRVNFTEGSDVHAGQVLAEVDPAPYRAVLEQALGTLHRDQAILAGAERDLTRYQHLLQTNAIPRQTVEDEEASVAQDKGTVQVDEGVVAAARVNLNWCRIVAPISGRAGVRLVDPGNIVSASGSTASTPSTASATSSASATGSSGSGIVVINQIRPIAVTFTVPEGQFEQLSTLSGGFSKPLAVQANSQESGELLDSGELRIADNKVDAATGTVELKARFTNDRKRLWPGQFIDVKLASQTLSHATVIPNTAVNRGPNGSFVFVVGADGKAVLRPIQILGSEGTFTAVSKGVNPGDVVVIDGQMTLKPGSSVRIVRPAPGATAS